MSLLALVQTGCLAAFAMLLIAAGWQDLRTLRIANRLSVATVASYAIWAAAGLALGRLSATALGMAIVGGLVVFAIGAIGFVGGIVGGGDVKLLTATSLFAGPSHMLDFLVITALVGGALGLALLAGAPIGPAAPAVHGALRARLRTSLPYGPAIAAGGLWVVATMAAA